MLPPAPPMCTTRDAGISSAPAVGTNRLLLRRADVRNAESAELTARLDRYDRTPARTHHQHTATSGMSTLGATHRKSNSTRRRQTSVLRQSAGRQPVAAHLQLLVISASLASSLLRSGRSSAAPDCQDLRMQAASSLGFMRRPDSCPAKRHSAWTYTHTTSQATQGNSLSDARVKNTQLSVLQHPLHVRLRAGRGLLASGVASEPSKCLMHTVWPRRNPAKASPGPQHTARPAHPGS